MNEDEIQESQNDGGGACEELPRYKSHKIVHALKIKSIVFDSDLAHESNRETDGSAMITPEEEFSPFQVDAKYVNKHQPQSGGYYVVYGDGYVSWSPGSEFEAGYTLIE